MTTSGFNVRGLAAVDIRRGDVAGYSDNEPTFVRHDETFVGQIQLMDIPKAVSVGYTPVFHAHTAQVAVKFMELLEKTNKSGKEANPSFLKTGRLSPSASNQPSQWPLSKWTPSLSCLALLSATWVRPSQPAFA